MSDDDDEDLVQAGSIPGGPFVQAHAGLVGLLFIITFLFGLLVVSVAYGVVVNGPVALYPFALVFALLPLPLLIIWWRFRMRLPGGRRSAVWAYNAMIGAFAVFGALQVLGGGSLFLGLMLVATAVYIWTRVRVVENPAFRAWYDEVSGVTPVGQQLERGEVMASCPHCRSLLAVRPDVLGPEDRCPHCDGRLVLSETIAALGGGVAVASAEAE